MPQASLKNRASSPIVIPCRIGIGNWPTNDSKPFTSIGPSICSPPIGFGRSVTMTGTPCFLHGAQAVRHRVHERVDARADVLQIDHQHVESFEHLRRRLPRLAVQRVDRHAASRIAARAPVSIMLSCTSAR